MALEAVASKWASTTPAGHNPNRSGKGAYTGENIYMAWASQKVSSLAPTIASDAVGAWYDEVKDFTKSDISPFVSGPGETGHYTQVVWADSDQVGCGIVYSKDSSPDFASYPYKITVVCNYQ